MKQVILVRTDLKMSKGKMSAQVAHASVSAVLKSSKTNLDSWRKTGMKKVILRVGSQKELLFFQRGLKREKLVSSLVKDAGKTFFKKPTITCLGIGPDFDKKIDKITGGLKLIS